MSSTPVTDLYNQLQHKYPHHRSSQALYFKPDPSTVASFRFETGLGWEFAQGFYIGPDPEGDFYWKDGYFNTGGLLPRDGEINADFYTEILTEQGENYVHVQFYGPNSSDLIGEFLARDEFNKAGNSGLLKQRKTGTWKKVDYDEYQCTASKGRGSTQITITNHSGTLKVAISCSQGDGIYNEAINDVDGKLYVKNRKTVAQQGTSVRWYSDYAVFHQGWNATAFEAFFYPFEGPEQYPLGKGNDYRWQNVQWRLD